MIVAKPKNDNQNFAPAYPPRYAFQWQNKLKLHLHGDYGKIALKCY